MLMNMVNKKLAIRSFYIITFCLLSNHLFAQTSLSERQRNLHNISKKACLEYNEGKNDIQRSEIYNKVNKEKERLGQKLDWQISDWKGNIMTISTNQGGDYADVEIVSEYNSIEISFEDLSTFGFGGVHKDEAVYDQLRNLSEGDPVIFSGKFEQGERGIQELSLTERGSICAPEFAIDLTNIKLNPEGSNRKSNAEEFAQGVEEGVGQMGNVIAWVFAIFFLFFLLIKILQGIGKKTSNSN